MPRVPWDDKKNRQRYRGSPARRRHIQKKMKKPSSYEEQEQFKGINKWRWGRELPKKLYKQNIFKGLKRLKPRKRQKYFPNSRVGRA